jgi:RNA polymerase sigma-70 factor (ECF subfamily)
MAGIPNDDPRLIHRALRGDVEAFNALVLRYQDSVYTLTYRIMGERHSAADATQEAFISAFRHLETYRGGSFRSWLLRIATNTCYDELRRRKRRPTTSLEELPGADSEDGPTLPAAIDTPEQALQQRELNDAIQNCINGLSDDQRVVLVMSDVQGISYQEIADATGAQLGTVKSRLSRARLGVRRCLQAFQELLPAEYRLTND